ncbi:MAG: hypothetical protein U9O82_12075 [Thermodesulfobacteriota bacterium]|nr:hypothetical protein [Thermodesulfobacteriota bacterium]
MKRFYSRKLKKTVVMLRAGEYCVSTEGDVLYTILGSCIATCIYDKKRKIGGMNHFLLPSRLHPDELLTSNMGRYGMYAMELLIGELLKMGARRSNLGAKIFGGGNVLNFNEGDVSITSSNINFARKYLKLEKIPIENEAVGGQVGRKIIFFSDSDRVLVKSFEVSDEPRILDEEKSYKTRVFSSRRSKSTAIIF